MSYFEDGDEPQGVDGFSKATSITASRLLNRWARNRPIRAENAAVTRGGLDLGLTLRALEEVDACIRRHIANGLRSTDRTLYG